MLGSPPTQLEIIRHAPVCLSGCRILTPSYLPSIVWARPECMYSRMHKERSQPQELLTQLRCCSGKGVFPLV